ncbi:MAG: hypothetical protein QM692_12900 [Thermomicrobiales bacterium]
MSVVMACEVLAASSGAVAAWQVGKRTPLRDLLMVAQATASPRACLGFVRFCLTSPRQGGER